MLYSFQWKPIEDLHDSGRPLANAELASLSRVWQLQRDTVQEDPALQTFTRELLREWSIETGIIENVYTLDRGVTRLLIEKGISSALISPRDTNKPPEEVAAILMDHEHVVEGLFDFVKQQRELSNSYIKELHAQLTQHQPLCTAQTLGGSFIEVPLLRGDWKKQPNNPTRSGGDTHQYCPPEHVAAEMDQLVAWHRQHVNSEVPPEVEAAWLHHRFTQIHPFMDGNGRVARCLASLVFLRAYLFPVVVTRDERTRYIDALEDADRGALEPLVLLFSELQRTALMGALTAAQRVRPEKTVDRALAAAAQELIQKHAGDTREWNRTKVLADNLLDLAIARVRSSAESIQAQLGGLVPELSCIQSSGRNEVDEYAFVQDAAPTLRYRPGLSVAWVRLELRTPRHFDIAFIFHGVGRQFRGILGVMAIYLWRPGNSFIRADEPVSEDLFRFNFVDTEASLRLRFEAWLEGAIAKGIDLWRQGL